MHEIPRFLKTRGESCGRMGRYKETYMELNCKDAEDFIITIRSARGDAAA